MGTMATITGGANAVIESCTDYENNVVVLTQCVNLADIKADSSDKVGGIAGHFQQYCYMSDCLNAGRYAGSSSNNSGIVDDAEGLSEIRHCLNVGAGWGSPICGSHSHDCVFRHNYFFDELYTEFGSNDDMDGLSLAELCSKSKFDSWSFSGDTPLWGLTEQSGYFPIPLKSEMQTKAETN